MKNENALPKLGLHRFITIVYLPLAIALNLYVAIGNIFSIGRLSLASFPDYVDALVLMLPFVKVVLFTVSLVALLGLTHFGRRVILFSETFITAVLLIIIFERMSEKRVIAALLYSASALVNMLIFAYYKRREYYFVRDGQSLKEADMLQKSTEEITQADTEKEETAQSGTGNENREEDTEEKACCCRKENEGKECICHGENPEEKECCCHGENETPEEKTCGCHGENPEERECCCHGKNQEEKECCCHGGDSPAETEKESTDSAAGDTEEEIVFTFTDSPEEYVTDDIQKKTKYIYAEKKEKSDVELLSSVLTVLPGRTVISLEVENSTETTFAFSEWKMMSDITFTSSQPIAPGKSTLTLGVDKSVDRLQIVLIKVE